VPCVADEEVVRLDVAMNDPYRVEVLQNQRDFSHVLSRDFLVEETELVQQIGKIA
jgi:hypothetical protein